MKIGVFESLFFFCPKHFRRIFCISVSVKDFLCKILKEILFVKQMFENNTFSIYCVFVLVKTIFSRTERKRKLFIFVNGHFFFVLFVKPKAGDEKINFSVFVETILCSDAIRHFSWVHTVRYFAITLKFLSPSATISNMFDIVALKKVQFVHQNTIAVVIAQCKPGFIWCV